MKIKFEGNRTEYLLVALVSLLAFGFPSIAYISLTLGVPSTPLAISYRFILVLISFYLILTSTIRLPIKLTWGAVFVVFFWVVYICRLVYDIVIVDIVRESTLSPFYVFSFAIGNCLLPFLAVILNKEHIRLSLLLKYSFYVILFQASLVFLLLYNEFGFNVEAFLSRQGLRGTEGIVLNAISISKAGGLLLIFAIYYWVLNKSTFTMKVAYFLSTLLGLYLLAAGGSRGPFLATVMIVLVLSAYYIYIKKFFGLFKFSILVTILFLVSSYFLYKLNVSFDDLAFIKRVQNTIEGDGDAARSFIWENAMNQFRSSIIFGDRFLVRATNFTVHNIFIDSLMSTGLLGSIFLFLSILIGMTRLVTSFFTRNSEILFMSLVFVFSLISYLVSGAIFIAVEFWAILAVVLSIDSTSIKLTNVESYRYTGATA